MNLVDKILAVLKLDDNGKITKFFDKEIKKFTQAIKALQQNLKTMELQHEIEVDELNQKIEDATVAVEDAYVNVSIEDLKSNESMESFSEEYWKNITAKEDYLKHHQDKLAKLEENYTEEVKKIQEQIDKYQSRIYKLNA